jgi:hypothetical protein
MSIVSFKTRLEKTGLPSVVAYATTEADEQSVLQKMNQPNNPVPTTAMNRKVGRSLFWSGIGLCFAGFIVAALQYGAVGSLIVPWYSPIMATFGAGLLLRSFVQRRTIVRFLGFAFIALLAGAQWYFLTSASKLPEYAGTAHVGEKFPAFETKLADGTSFTNLDLESGPTTVLTFFRGRW